MDEFEIDGLPPEDLLVIDIDEINQESKDEARTIVRIVSDLFYDEEFRKEHPQIYRRIELEVDTLRSLIKMRKADEEVHDALLRAITENKTNASLYRSMAEIQRTSISLSNKIHDTMDRLNRICSDLTGTATSEDIMEDGGDSAHRGSKSFIADMMENESRGIL